MSYSKLISLNNILLLVVGCTIGLFSMVLSIGFDTNSISLITNSILISSVLLLLPEIIKIIFNKIQKTQQDYWFTSVPFNTISVLLMVVLAGLLQSSYEIKLGNYIIYMGIILTIGFIINYIISCFRLIDLCYMSLFIVFSIFIGSVIWETGLNGPFLIELMSVIDLKEIDTLYHAAIMGMIKTHGVPSTGLDGIPYLPYHWGSHWIYAQFSSLINVDTLRFSTICFPIIFIPLYLKSYLIFIQCIRKYRKINSSFNYTTYTILVFVFIHFIATFVGNPIGSPSYVLSLTFTFLFLSIIIEFLMVYSSNKSVFSDNLMLLFIIPLFISLITLIKPQGIILMGVFCYLFLRLKWYRDIRLGFSFLLSSVLLLMILFYTTPPSHIQNFNIINTIHAIVKYAKISFIFQYLWLAIFIYTFLLIKKVKTIQDIKNIVKSKRYILEIEILPAIFIIGLIPGIISNLLIGGLDFYFYNFQYWVSLCFVLAYLPIFINSFKLNDIFLKRDLKMYFIIFVVAGITLDISASFFSQFSNNIRNNIIFRQDIIGEENKIIGIKPFIKENFKEHSIIKFVDRINKFTESSQVALNDNKKYQLIKIIQKFNNIDRSEKKKTCIYIPKANRIFWDMQSSQSGTPFLIPALTGIAMIEGLPEYLPPYPANSHRGYHLYDSKYNNHLRDSYVHLTVDDLKSKAEQHGYSRIIRIDYNNSKFIVENIYL
jgi:hypothetical protein